MTREYIVGFFDGEGCIHISKGKVRIVISQTNEAVLLKIKEFVGFGCVYKEKKRKDHHKDSWCYRTTGNDQSLLFLKLVQDSITKQDKVSYAINMLTMIKLNKENIIAQVLDLLKKDLSYREIGRRLQISRTKVMRIKRECGVMVA